MNQDYDDSSVKACIMAMRAELTMLETHLRKQQHDNARIMVNALQAGAESLGNHLDDLIYERERGYGRAF